MAAATTSISSGFQEHQQRISNEFKTTCDLLGGRISNLEGFADRQAQTNSEVSKEIRDLQHRTNDLEIQLRFANQNAISREDLRSDAFDRPPNLEIIRVKATRYVTKRSVHDALAPWLAEVDIKDNQWVLEGREPQGKFFVIRFQLNPLSAARMVQDALGNLKDQNGNWKTINAKLINGQLEKLHIGGDESEAPCFRRKMESAVLSPLLLMWKGFFLWNNEALPGLGINKNILLDKIMQLLERSDVNIEWRL